MTVNAVLKDLLLFIKTKVSIFFGKKVFYQDNGEISAFLINLY